MKPPKKQHYTTILEFTVIKLRTEMETVGEILKLSQFGEYCPDNSLRGYSLTWLLDHPEYYRASKVISQGTEVYR